jgi:hypothetical protein
MWESSLLGNVKAWPLLFQEMSASREDNSTADSEPFAKWENSCGAWPRFSSKLSGRLARECATSLWSVEGERTAASVLSA